MLKFRSNWRVSKKSWMILALMLAVLMSADSVTSAEEVEEKQRYDGLQHCTEESVV